MPSPAKRLRAATERLRAQALQEGRVDWFRVGQVRNEVVGEQDGGDNGRSTADVYVFERIGGWSGTSADDFVRDVAGLDVDHIDLHLNSPGGDAWEGVAIANVLRQHRADVTVWVDGIAASAASVIAMAGDEIVMSVGAQMMIHDASALAIGQASDMRKAAEMLDSASNAIASTYAAKAGGTADDWRAVMVEETWYTADEAVAAGLADRVATDEDKKTASGEQIVPGSSTSFWDMWDSLSDAQRHSEALQALYDYAGRDNAPPPRMPGDAGAPKTPAASAGGSTSPLEDDDMSTLTEGLSQRLGIAEDADEATILAALDALKARADKPAELPDNMATVDKAVLDELRAAAQAGVEARQQQQAERRTQLIEAAIKDGRISPSKESREGWAKALATDPHAEANLAALAPGLIPVTGELGHASADSNTDIDNYGDELDELATLAGLPKGALR